MVTKAFDRKTGICAIVYAILFVVAMLMVPDLDSGSSLDKYLSSSSEQTHALIAVYAAAVGGLCFFRVLVGLRRRLVASAGRHTGMGLFLTISGIAHIVAFWAGIMGTAFLAGAEKFAPNSTSSPLPKIDPDVVFAVSQFGMGMLLIFSAFAAIGVLVAAIALIKHTRGLPVWFAVFSVLVAIALVFGVLFIPLLAWPLWLLVTGIVLLITAGATGSATPDAATSAV